MEQTKLNIEWWALADIKPYENNPRINEHAVDKMAAVIREFGIRRPLLVRADGGLIDGHLTLKGALRAGATHGPVLICDDLSEDQIQALRLVMNKSAEWAQWDEEKLRQELQNIMDTGFDMDMIGFDQDELNQLLASSPFAGAAELDLEARKSLQERFIVPPFSILDTRQGYWQDRKASWMQILPDSREGRVGDLTFNSSLDRFCHIGTTSQFDPVLCEVLYRWFCPAGGQIIDPFSGGSVRGLVAAVSGFSYIGIDIREEQIESNQSHWAHLASRDWAGPVEPKWICGDSQELDSFDLPLVDFIFSCPPYGDLEVYSDDPNDLSNMDYPTFIESYRRVVVQAVAGLHDNRFACFVVGEIRDKKGHYRRFVSDTIQAFEAAGARYYNEMILINVAGSLPVRAANAFNVTRKVGKSHQNVLVFIKGDPREAAQEIGTIETEFVACNKGL
jgi:hypothetical protein